MNAKTFDSDSVRTAKPLRYVKTAEFDQPVTLERGGRLESLHVAYETYGRLNERGDNAVLICHALSGDSHVARHDEQDDPGWWDIAVGPGRCIDTEKYFVICPNVLGGCRGTTGPNSINPATGRHYGADFPVVTMGDMVDVQRRLVDELGVRRLLAVVGGSMGGHQALLWPLRYPDRVAGTVVLASSPRLSSQALAFDIVARNAILRDPHFHGGQYYDHEHGPDVGLAIARMIGHITYLSREAMHEKFEADRLRPRDVPVAFEAKFSVGSYLGYQGARFVERFDANSYITISMAMDLFDLGGSFDLLRQALRPSACRWLVTSFSSDWLFSPAESRQIVDALIAENKPVSYCDVSSRCGHDAFLLEDDLHAYGALVCGFLAELSGEPRQACRCSAPRLSNPASIFCPDHPHRLDTERIVELIEPGSAVLDLGCGPGELLEDLAERGHARLLGVELNQEAVVSCVERGLDVVHADLNAGLAAFADGQFDVVVLSRTLQSIRDVENVMREMLRVGRRCIVSFPNFAYHKLRRMLAEKGRAPEASGLLAHKWYNSPNIRFFSIADFEEFCSDRGITIHRRIALDTEDGHEVNDDVNLNADLAIFVLSR